MVVCGRARDGHHSAEEARGSAAIPAPGMQHPLLDMPMMEFCRLSLRLHTLLLLLCISPPVWWLLERPSLLYIQPGV